jgi:hypothetical protein
MFSTALSRSLRDPIRFSDWKTRSEAKMQRLQRYGPTMAQARRMAIHSDPNMSRMGQQRLANRMQDGFVGRGRYYRKRRRYRGRGMYTGGPYTGQGSYKSLFKRSSREMSTPSSASAANGDTMTGQVMDTGLTEVEDMPGISHLRGSKSAKVNTLIEGGPRPVQFDSTYYEHGDLIVTDTEKIMDVYGNPEDVHITVHDIPIQPGMFTSFPKLSQTAVNWKEYECIQIIYEFKSSIPTHFTTESLSTGRIYMATQHNLNKDNWTTVDEFEAQENKTVLDIQSIGIKTGLHGVECDPSKLTTKALKFVRTRNEDNIEDFDHGRFQFAVFGTGEKYVNQMIGELFVHYKIRLKQHRLFSNHGYSIPQTKVLNENTLTTGTIDETLYSVQASQAFAKQMLKFEDIWTRMSNPDGDSYNMVYNNIDYTFLPCEFERKIKDGTTAGVNLREWVGTSFPLYGSTTDVLLPSTTKWAGDTLSNNEDAPLYACARIHFPGNLKGDFVMKFETVVSIKSDPVTIDDFRKNLSCSGSHNSAKILTFGNVKANNDIIEPHSFSTTTGILSYKHACSSEGIILHEPMITDAETTFYVRTFREVHIHIGQASNLFGQNEVIIPVPLIAGQILSHANSANNPIDELTVHENRFTIEQYNSQQIFGDNYPHYFSESSNKRLIADPASDSKHVSWLI